MTDRLRHLYGLFRCVKFNVKLVGRSQQLYRMPAADALDMARRYIAITADLDLRPGISVGAPSDKSAFRSWRY